MIQFHRVSALNNLPSDFLESSSIDSVFLEKINNKNTILNAPITEIPIRVKEDPKSYLFEAQVFIDERTISLTFEEQELTPLQKFALELIERQQGRNSPFSFLSPECQLNVSTEFAEYADRLYKLYEQIHTAMQELSEDTLVVQKTLAFLDFKFEAYLAKLLIDQNLLGLANKYIERCCEFKIENEELQEAIYSDVMLGLLRSVLAIKNHDASLSSRLTNSILDAHIFNIGLPDDFIIRTRHCDLILPVIIELLNNKDLEKIKKVSQILLSPDEFKHVLALAINKSNAKHNDLIIELGQIYLNELGNFNPSQEQKYWNSPIMMTAFPKLSKPNSYFRIEDVASGFDCTLLSSMVNYYARLSKPELAEQCLMAHPDGQKDLVMNVSVLAAYKHKVLLTQEDQGLVNKTSDIKVRVDKLLGKAKDRELAYATLIFKDIIHSDDDFLSEIDMTIRDDGFGDLELLIDAIKMHKIGKDAKANAFLSTYLKSDVSKDQNFFTDPDEVIYFKDFIFRLINELQDPRTAASFSLEIDKSLLSLLMRCKHVLDRDGYCKNLLILVGQNSLKETFDFLETEYLDKYESSSVNYYLNKAEIAFLVDDHILFDKYLNLAFEKLSEIIGQENIFPENSAIQRYLNSASDILLHSSSSNNLELSAELVQLIIEKYSTLQKQPEIFTQETEASIKEAANLNKLIIEKLFNL